MLHSLKDITGFELAALDGTIGHVREAYFDDRRWVIRHLVVDTGSWLSGRRVLVSPHAVRAVDRGARRLAVTLRREQVQQSPSIATDRPVSRQYEIAAYDFYGYPYYWGGSSLWGMMDMPLGGAIGPFTPPPPAEPPDEATRERIEADKRAADPHLRSSEEVGGYDVSALDGAIGHVDDFLFDDASWQIRLVVVDTHNWLPDRLVLLPPDLVDRVDWAARTAAVRTGRQTIRDSPRYERHQVLDRETAARVQRYYEQAAGRPGTP